MDTESRAEYWRAVALIAVVALGSATAIVATIAYPELLWVPLAHVLAVILAAFTRRGWLVGAIAVAGAVTIVAVTAVAGSGITDEHREVAEAFQYATAALTLVTGALSIEIVRRERSARRVAAAHKLAAESVEFVDRSNRMLDAMPITMWVADPDGAVTYFNRHLRDFSGRTDAELLGSDWTQIVHPDDLPGAYERWDEAMRTLQPYAHEFRFRRRDGEYEWFSVAATVERDDDGNVARWIGTAVNIDATRALEAQSRAAADERERILQSIGEGVSAIDRDWTFTFISERGAELVDSTPEQIVGGNMWELFPETRGSELEGHYSRALFEGKHESFEYFNPRLQRRYEANLTPSGDGITVTFRDITEVSKLREQFALSQRLESVGQLTGGIAHDFNNLLTVIIGGADALREAPELTDGSRELAGLVGEAAARGADLTTTLLAFARKMPLAPQATDVNAQVSALLPLLRRTIGERYDLRLNLGDDVPRAQVDATQLESAIVNLAINGRDAMPDGGTVIVETRVATIDDEYAQRVPELEPGSYVVVAVSDTGTGIDPSHLDRLFEPFFTTKGPGKGSGLGLPMVWGFAKQSGGHVTVYSELGLGTTFNIYVPVADGDESEPATIESAIGTDTTGTATVLVAEDDELVRAFAAEQLRTRGYTVVTAADGPEAIAALDTIDHLDLLFTDVVMPGGYTGKELAAAVRERRPGVAVLYASGYTENVILHDGRLDAGVTLLAKPYTGKQLGAAVARVLDGSGKE